MVYAFVPNRAPVICVFENPQCASKKPPLRKGSCRRSRLRGRFFGGARTLLPIRLLRCPDRSLTAKPAQRATDGRPYELKSVPTKTVAIRTTGNCSDLVQKLCQHPCLPLRGEGVGASRRMRWNSIRALAHTSIIHYSFAGTACGRAMSAPTNRF